MLGFCLWLVALAGLRADDGGRAPDGADAARHKTMETWGWVVAQEQGVAGIEIGARELDAFAEGFRENLRGDPLTPELRRLFPDIEPLAKERRRKLVRAIELRNEAAAERFFADLKRLKHPEELPGGVLCEVVRPGEGAPPKPEQTVTVRYVGRLIDGTEFTEFGPLDLVLVPARGVCRGWIDALRRLGKGGAMTLYVPPPLPEAEAEKRGIEPGSAMIFEIELLGIKDTARDALESSLAPPPMEEAPPTSGAPILQVFEVWGWSVAQQAGIAALGLAEGERGALTEGLLQGVKGRAAPADFEKTRHDLEAFIADLRAGARRAAREKRREEMEALFARLKTDPAVVELPSGLRYEILRRGAGAFPKAGQIVLVDYVGRLIDGSVFDRTDNEPLNVEVGSVIRGWNEGIQLINRGGKIRLYIPPELGYKEQAISGHSGPIPAGSTLIYEIELLDIRDSLPGPEVGK